MTTAISAQSAVSKMLRVFAGKAWKNVSMSGKAYLNGNLDKGFVICGTDVKTGAEVSIDLSGLKFQLWDNAKREGKKDADFRLSFLMK